MSIAGLKITLKSYFGFNFVYAGIIALFIYAGIHLFLLKKKDIEDGSVSIREIRWGIVLSIYLALLIGGTMLNRGVGEVCRMELMPFWSYRQYFVEKHPALLGQMVYNVLVFVPWPFLFAQVFSAMKRFRWAIGSAFLFSVFIEITQLVLKIGLFEFDDMFHNTLGAVIGYGILTLYSRRKQKGVDE